MTYFPRSPMGLTELNQGRLAMGQVLPGISDSLKKIPPPPSAPPPKKTSSSGGGSWWDSITSGAGSVLDYFTEEQKRKQKEAELAIAQQQAMASGGTPGWVLPAVAVAGIVGAVVLLRKK